MVYTVGDVVNNVVCIPFCVLHVLMIVFILRVRRHNANYKTAFFKLFVCLTLVDLFTVVINFGGIQLHRFGPPSLFQWYLQDRILVRIWYFFSGWTLYVQCFLHLSIVVNRYWVMENILAARHLNPHLMQLAHHSLWLFPLICFGLVFRRAFAETVYVQRAEGSLAPKYVDPAVQEYHSTVAFLVLVFTGTLSFVFQMLALWRYKQILNQARRIPQDNRRDFRIMFQALVMLVFHILLGIIEISIFIGSITGQLTVLARYYSHVDNVFCCSGSAVLVLVSKYVRHDLVRFYCPRLAPSTVSPLQGPTEE